MRLLTFLALPLALAVAGCTTMTPAERRLADEQTCQSYGFRAGTDAFASCLLELDLDRRAERRERLNRPPPLFGPPVVVYREVPRTPTGPIAPE